MKDKEHLIKEILTRGVEEVIDMKEMEKALAGTKKLRIKHGIDPTGKGIHIGRAVVLWKLRAFQELGHKIVLIIGDMTAQIGDPSDKLEKRPFLTSKEIKENLKNYLAQIGKVIDIKKTEVRYNSEWLRKLNFQEISALAEIFSVQQMISRRNFKERWEKEQDISLREMLYPLMQGYDSVAVKADVEIGGSDQLFNLLAGRKIQERYGQKPQQVITTAMLSGLDGRKMSTSWGNVVKIGDSPEEQFGKIMSIHDDMMGEYLLLATDIPRREIREYENELKVGTNPKEIKEILAEAVVRRYYGEKKAQEARAQFDRLFSKKEVNEDDLLTLKFTGDVLLSYLLQSGIVKSNSESRRLIEQGGVRVNDISEKDLYFKPKKGDILKIGKKSFFQVK